MPNLFYIYNSEESISGIIILQGLVITKEIKGFWFSLNKLSWVRIEKGDIQVDCPSASWLLELA